jgi:phosphoribosylamine--glycine ligase
MNIAIIGAGGREHAMEWKLTQSPAAGKIFTIPGNGGTSNNARIDPLDFEAVDNFCRANKVGLIIPGAETYLKAGIADYFKYTEIPVFGPDKKTAWLETSKIFSKKFMGRHNIPTARTAVPQDRNEAVGIIHAMNGKSVIKYDGLAEGKGVFVCDSLQEALSAITYIEKKFGAGENYLIEERLAGREASIIGITDGRCIRLFSPSRDHKRAFDGETGPNTGGMGAYCPPEDIRAIEMEEIRDQIVEPTLKGMAEEGLAYKGFIYFGLMLTDEGPKLLEYNVRPGDPETQVILPALKTDLLELIKAAMDEKLSGMEVEFNEGHYTAITIASGGYPEKYETGKAILGLDKNKDDILIFHAGTKVESGITMTAGGRVITVVSRGRSLKESSERAYERCKGVYFDNMRYRSDIGRR